MQISTLDDFTDVSAWSAIASGQAELHIARTEGPDGAALCLTYDFKGGGGFIVARKLLHLSLPEAYAFSFALRGDGPPNNFELKLVDPSNKSVWRYQRPGFDLPNLWQQLVVRSRDIEFAWGPAGGGPMAEVGAIEIALAAGSGGAGTLCVAGLQFQDRSFASLASVAVSSCIAQHEPGCAVDRNPGTSWRSAPGLAPQWYQIDFQQQREYGGLIVTWDHHAPPARVEIQSSADGSVWKTERVIESPAALRSYVSLPDGTASSLRLQMQPRSNAGVGIVDVEVKPFEFSRSPNEFFHNIALRERRGLYPKYWRRQQTYWTPIGNADGDTTAIMNQEGMVEVGAGSFSIEPFLYVEGKLITWADVASDVRLEDDCLPLPSSCWRYHDITFEITAFAAAASLFVRYRARNGGATAQQIRLLLALRPFQVTPPWQSFRDMGGVSPLREVDWHDGALRINGMKSVVPLPIPTEVGAAPFETWSSGFLENGAFPRETRLVDSDGYLTAVMSYDLKVDASSREEIFLMIPARDPTASPPAATAAQIFERACDSWRARLGAIDFEMPPTARAAIATLRTATAHILVNRDGPALQPGPRRYTRSWIRDGAIMAAALLRAGCIKEACDFARWYAPFQRADGFVPCCVDRDGIDWLVEHDSHGQLIHVVMECFRFTNDVELVREMWPVACRAVDYIESLRRERLSAEYETPERLACYGLLPESASHEGYLAHPVHSYWDDFWALRGLKDAAAMAELLGEPTQAERVRRLHAALAESLYASIRRTIAIHHLNYIPGSVEWADFDPTATANAVAMLDESANLPKLQLDDLFEIYLDGFRRKHSGEMDWTNYSPYEIRIIGALVRRGQRQSAYELLSFFLADRRPLAWNQWPEIAWRDPTSPGHIGDMPHAWIAAEYALSLLSMFVFEREADRALVVGAGIPHEWLESEVGVAARGLRTWYGALDVKMWRDQDGAIHISLGGHITAHKIILRPPLRAPLSAVTVNGVPLQDFGLDEAIIDALPADVVMR